MREKLFDFEAQELKMDMFVENWEIMKEGLIKLISFKIYPPMC